MAEGVIISFTKKLSSLLAQEYKFLQGVEKQVVFLRDELEWIGSFLRDAALQRSNHERVDVWVSQIRDLAYDAEDILDIFINKVKRQRERSWLGLSSKYPLICPGPPVILHNLATQIDSINARIEKISAYKSKYAIDKLEDKDSLDRDVRFKERITRATSDTVEDLLIGLDHQSADVAEILLKKGGDSSQLLVVSIVGMPGIGKSTLANKVYNEVKHVFDSFSWINVTQKFESQHILKIIREGNLNGKLLVVFDDVWKKQDWDVLLRDVLEKIKIETKEIRVLITTRFHDVAKHAKSRLVHRMRELDENDSFELLKKVIFGEIPRDLEKLAEKIVHKCGGLPLAIVVLGGLLSTKQRTINVWTKVVKTALWHLSEGSTECFEVLALSYDDLPNYLKPCFLYLGLFPGDHSIDCETLIQLWVAEGFIQERGEASMEEVAEDYIEELIQRNIIQAVKRRFNGSLETCGIHDLLREFAVSRGRQDKFLDILGEKRSASVTMSRRLSVHSTCEASKLDNEILDSSSSNNPRSIMCFTNLSNKKFEDVSFYERFPLLRVLDLQGAKQLQSLPDAIGKLVLLKYLNLHGVQIKQLPSSISNLQNLQTLDVSETQINVGIPGSICELEELRHFYGNLKLVADVKECSCNLLSMIKDNFLRGVSMQFRSLKNLQTLSTGADDWISNDFSRLITLRKLKITNVNMVLHGELLSSSILKLIYLRELDIDWNKGMLKFPDSLSQHENLYKMTLSGNVEELPIDPNVFPPNLTELELFYTRLKQDGDSMKTLAELKNLQYLKLQSKSFLGNQMVFPENGFPNLTHLDLGFLYDLEEWQVKEGSLPKLKVLYLFRLDTLRELPDGLEKVTTLQKLGLSLMPPLLLARIKGDDMYKIRHVKTVEINGSQIWGGVGHLLHN